MVRRVRLFLHRCAVSLRKKPIGPEDQSFTTMIFLLLLAIVSLTAVFLWFWINRHNWREQGYMLAGSVFLVTFVL